MSHPAKKAQVLALANNSPPLSVEEIAKKSKTSPALVTAWLRAAGVAGAQRPSSPAAKVVVPPAAPTPAPVVDSTEMRRLQGEVESLREQLAAKDRRITELLDTVAGLSALVVKRG